MKNYRSVTGTTVVDKDLVAVWQLKFFSRGREVSDVYARAGASGLWAQRSSAIARYCDFRARRFFEGESAISFEEFKVAEPEVLHGLAPLPSVQRRPPS